MDTLQAMYERERNADTSQRDTMAGLTAFMVTNASDADWGRFAAQLLTA